MSEQRASTVKMVFLALVGVALFSAVTSYVMVTSKAEAKACHIEDGVLGNFQTPNEALAVPDTVYFDGAGAERRLTDLRGRGIVLNFWATWCAPCVREMPQLDRLKELVAANGVDVLAISEDRQGALVVKKFYAANKLHSLDILVDKGSKLIRSLKGRGLPTTVLFNKMGQEVGRVTGIAEWDSPEAVAFIRRCLGNSRSRL